MDRMCADPAHAAKDKSALYEIKHDFFLIHILFVDIETEYAGK